MRKIFTLLLTLTILTSGLMAQGTRYIDEVFSNVGKLQNMPYCGNVTVVTGTPAADTLLFDLYFPIGDTCTSRPLAVVLHTGTFLPRGLFAPTGDKDDYANVQICERLAKRGYVAASVQYRAGWNPIATSDTVRRSTIINAAYRAVQDLFAFVRYANLTVENFGNPYKIDTSRIAVFGVGTGGFVAFNAAILQQDEIYIDKFTNPSGTPMIDTNLVGNLTGEKPGLINVPNHVGFSNKFHFVFGLDGAVGDSSWMEDGKSVPLVAAGTVTHPTTPYGIDPLDPNKINCDLPVYSGVGTGSFVVNIGGSLCMLDKANKLGINNPLSKGDYSDPVSNEIRSNPNVFGNEHLWGINLPGPQTGPWEYWDSTFWKTVPFPGPGGLSIHDVAISTNPDMSIEKANHYIDTALWFFSPRSYAALKLGELVCSCTAVVPDPHLVNDFECQRNFNFGAGADRLMIMNNPLSNANNSSEKVGRYLDTAHDAWAALCVNFGGPIDLSTYNQFLFQVSSTTPGPLLCKLEGGTSPAFEKWLTIAGTGDWENITADFSSQAAENHTRVCLFPNGGVESPTEDTYWLDNLRWDIANGVFTPTVEKLEISPNPVSNILYIRNPGDAVHFRVFNALGQPVKDISNSGLPIVTIIMGDLTPGIYMVGGFNADGRLVANASILKD
jgi:hypothetical protein